MTPEANDYLAKARKTLQEAHAVKSIALPEAAGRAAYLAAHHAAQAFIFERTGKIMKTHNGVQTEFARLAKGHPNINQGFAAFLSQAYNLKTIADYAVGSRAEVSLEDAADAIEMADRFVTCISELLR